MRFRPDARMVLALTAIIAYAFLNAGCSHEKAEPKSIAPNLNGQVVPGSLAPNSGAQATGGKKRIVFVFKSGGGAYSEACKRGAEQANSDPALNVTVDYQASAEGTAKSQTDIVEEAIVGHPDAIVVSPVDSKAIVGALNEAMNKGIKVFTWDADSPTSKRLYYFAAVDDVQIGDDIGTSLANSMGEKGKVLIFSGQSTAENLNSHVKGIEQALAKYPGISILKPYIYNDDDASKATPMAVQALQRNSDVAGIACSNAPSPPAAAEAISKNPALKGKIKVWGLSLPSMCSKYLKDGTVTGLYLWDPQKLTYDTAMLVKQVLDGKSLNSGDPCGTEGKIEVNNAVVTLPLRLEINKGNVDSLKF